MGQAHYTDALSKASREMGIEPVEKDVILGLSEHRLNKLIVNQAFPYSSCHFVVHPIFRHANLFY